MLRLRSTRIVTPAGVVSGEVCVRDGLIETIGPPTDADAIELGSHWIVPGFIDLHVHGGGGAQCNTSDPDEVRAVARFHVEHGTTSLLATTVAAPVDDLVEALGAIRGAAGALGTVGTVATVATAATVGTAAGAAILGAHLEGPFLNPRRAGAMNSKAFLAPAPDVIRRLLLAGEGCLSLMTLAPELSDADLAIAELVEAGVVVSLGHSEATYDQARAAVRLGARSATHLFNAMPPFHHRGPGLLGAALDLPELACELICDGVHVDPVALRLAHRLKGSAGIHLVTDAVSAAGMPDGGGYRLGAAAVDRVGGRAVLSGTDSPAGSTVTMDTSVANAVRWLDIPVAEAVAMASGNPARLLGLEDRKGAIGPGMDADLAVLDDDLRACATLVAGTVVFDGATRPA